MSRVYADFPWRVFITTLAGAVITDLDNRGTDRQFLFTLNGPAYHTGQVGSDDLEINRAYPADGDPAGLTNNRRLLFAVRRELTPPDTPYVPRFGGILMPIEDQGADAPTTRYTAYDPWQYMMSRPFRHPVTGALLGEKGYTYATGERASNIVLDSLATTEAQDGESHIDFSDLGLIEDTTPLPAPFVISQTQSIGEVWQALCDTGTIDILLDPIYDPHLRPTKVCELRIAVFAGTIRFDSVMGWDTGSHSLVDMTRTIADMANKVRWISGAAKQAVAAVDAASVAANGIYWSQQSSAGAQHQAEADLLALAEMYVRRNGAREISFSPVADRLDYTPLRDYALGDYLPVWASRNLREPIAVDYDAYAADPDFPGAAGFQRVYAIPITVDDNGVERVESLVTSQDSVIG